MDVKDFFKMAKVVCDDFGERSCSECPITSYCTDGIFASENSEIESMIKTVTETFDEID